ncbi:MAG: MarR family transcriptional regulator [Oscillospiraceae bacterium]|jgi:DNA-binding MarR family transcriptional regulator|nr:MarR family transcriptional regulator [Oscillospiraceae bacterium]
MHSHTLGNILSVGRCCRVYRARALEDTALRPAQQMLLSLVCRRPGLAQEELITGLHLDKTTVAHQLTKLEEEGYIRREIPAEDGRCRLVYPTEKASAVYPRIHEAFEGFTAAILAGLDESEQAELERLTEHLRRNALALLEPEGGKEA